MDTKIILQLVLISILTLINAFFAAAEMAIVSLDKNKIKIMAENNNKKAQLIMKLLEEPTRFLSTIQVGITFAGFFSSASAATGISSDFANLLESYNVPYSNQIAIALITILLSYVMLVFGELFPKRLALQKKETIAMVTVKPINYIAKIMNPFVKLLSGSINILIKIFGLDNEELKSKVSEEEIRLLIEVGKKDGVINQTEKEMINSIFEFNDKLAREVMVPRTDVFLINIRTPFCDVLDEFLKEKHSRVPVYDDDKDNIIGIILLKDYLVEARKYGFDNINIKRILHPPYFVPETKPIDRLFTTMQRLKKHMAILVDEYGGFSGIVTMEDLMEEVFGEIDDEFDVDNYPDIEQIDTHIYMVNGLVTVNDFNHFFKLNLDNHNVDTISGFLIDILGDIPSTDEKISVKYENLIFEIEQVKDRRIEKVKIIRNNLNNNDDRK